MSKRTRALLVLGTFAAFAAGPGGQATTTIAGRLSPAPAGVLVSDALAAQQAPELGIPANVVNFTPASVTNRTFAVTDYTYKDNPKVGIRQGTTEWRVVMGTGNAAEIWITTSKEGRLFDLGGRYINFSDDRGLTWKSVQPLDPLVNAEGSVVMAPNGDVLGVTWDPYSGDRVFTFKFSAAEQKWYYTYNPVHTPFWDRPGIDVVPGPFVTPLGTVPYISFINGFPHDPWYYSTDGLNYVNVSSIATDEGDTEPVDALLDVKADPSFDWIQPNMYFPFAALGEGRAIMGSSHYFSPTDMKWHIYTGPSDLPGDIQTDSRGRIHSVSSSGGGFDYRISTDGGLTWKSVHAPDGSPGDFRANAATGIGAVWALKGKQDLVYTFDVTGDEPKLLRRYVVGKGDDSRTGSLATYGLTGGHRFDFSSITVFPGGRIAVSFMDTLTRMPFPTLAQEVIAPGMAIELETTLPPLPDGCCDP